MFGKQGRCPVASSGLIVCFLFLCAPNLASHVQGIVVKAGTSQGIKANVHFYNFERASYQPPSLTAGYDGFFRRDVCANERSCAVTPPSARNLPACPTRLRIDIIFQPEDYVGQMERVEINGCHTALEDFNLGVVALARIAEVNDLRRLKEGYSLAVRYEGKRKRMALARRLAEVHEAIGESVEAGFYYAAAYNAAVSERPGPFSQGIISEIQGWNQTSTQFGNVREIVVGFQALYRGMLLGERHELEQQILLNVGFEHTYLKALAALPTNRTRALKQARSALSVVPKLKVADPLKVEELQELERLLSAD